MICMSAKLCIELAMLLSESWLGKYCHSISAALREVVSGIDFFYFLSLGLGGGLKELIGLIFTGNSSYVLHHLM